MTLRNNCARCGWVLSLLVGAALSGCATRGAVARLHADLNRTHQDIGRLRLQVAGIDSLLRLHDGELRRHSVEEAMEAESSQRQLQQTQARLDEIARRLTVMVDGMDAMRVYGGMSSPAPVATAAVQPAPVAGPGIDLRGLYDQALTDMKAGDYTLAAAELTRVLEGAPDSDLANNAGYWLGECHYARRDFARAAAAFEQVVQAHPAGDKVPPALLKLGYALPEVRQKKKGVQYLNELLQRFPGSEEATLARTRLKALGEKVPPQRG